MLSGTGLAGLVGLASALLWGGGDFCGGMGARRMSALRVVLASHTASFISLVLLALLVHSPLPNHVQLFWGILAGIAGGVGLMSFYTALSLGHMGSSAALSGLIAAAIPVAFAESTEGLPGWRRAAGFALAAVAIWLIAGSKRSQDHSGVARRAFALAITAGVGFGVFMSAIKLAGEGSVVSALASARIGSIGITLLATLWTWQRSRSEPNAHDEPDSSVSGPRSLAQPGTAHSDNSQWAGLQWAGQPWDGLRWAMAAALLDTTGNLIYIAATRMGRLDVAAVLGSLYPASTILLAAWVLHERPTPRQALGMVAALAAVVAITTG